ncbi:unnamed protein product [Meganyctiphanes norvegica]|uniref:Uncharacterized protein n=1 Tax=Meganyctiphanes norvegica TaxID=48144 RepID=A0AAV2QNE4_MEGNR
MHGHSPITQPHTLKCNITNYKDIKQFLMQKGDVFGCETGTEIIAKLIDHLHNLHPKLVQQLDGAFGLCLKSVHFPGELVTTRHGSPLVVSINTKAKLATDHTPVVYTKDYTVSKNIGVFTTTSSIST